MRERERERDKMEESEEDKRHREKVLTTRVTLTVTTGANLGVYLISLPQTSSYPGKLFPCKHSGERRSLWVSFHSKFA